VPTLTKKEDSMTGLILVTIILFAWQAWSNWDAEQTDETIRIRKKIKDEARWREIQSSPMSMGHALDIVIPWSPSLMVIESEGLNNDFNEKDEYQWREDEHLPLEVSPDPYDVMPIPAPKEKVINVLFHADPVVDVNGYQLFIGKDSHGPMTYWLMKPNESYPRQLNPSEFKGLIDGDKYGVEFHRALWLAYSNRSVQTIYDDLD
jgi:hypothetical protein